MNPRARVFVQYATIIVFLAASNFALYVAQKFFPAQIPSLLRSWEGYIIMSATATLLGFVVSRLLIPTGAIQPQVSMIRAAGWATLVTFFFGFLIFMLERLRLVAMFAVQPLPWLTWSETFFLIFFATWFFLFLFFSWIGLMRLRRTMP